MAVGIFFLSDKLAINELKASDHEVSKRTAFRYAVLKIIRFSLKQNRIEPNAAMKKATGERIGNIEAD